MVLLWTNSSPKSGFNPQTINLDLSGYSFVMITAQWSTSYQRIVSPLILTVPSEIARLDSTDTQGASLTRDVTVTTTGVTFGSGALGTGANNSMMIPYQIFGIKA